MPVPTDNDYIYFGLNRNMSDFDVSDDYETCKGRISHWSNCFDIFEINVKTLECSRLIARGTPTGIKEHTNNNKL